MSIEQKFFTLAWAHALVVTLATKGFTAFFTGNIEEASSRNLIESLTRNAYYGPCETFGIAGISFRFLHIDAIMR
jgi:hypothetical protein